MSKSFKTDEFSKSKKHHKHSKKPLKQHSKHKALEETPQDETDLEADLTDISVL